LTGTWLVAVIKQPDYEFGQICNQLDNDSLLNDYHLLGEQTLDTKLTFYWRYEHIININILIHLKNYDFGI
jgi:hypothetical protein